MESSVASPCPAVARRPLDTSLPPPCTSNVVGRISSSRDDRPDAPLGQTSSLEAA